MSKRSSGPAVSRKVSKKSNNFKICNAGYLKESKSRREIPLKDRVTLDPFKVSVNERLRWRHASIANPVKTD